MDLTTIFYHVDNFSKQFDKWLISRLLMMPPLRNQTQKQMTDSEIMSVLIYYAACSKDIKHFKAFYEYKRGELEAAFPFLVSYERMIELKETVELRMMVFLMSSFSSCTEKLYIDSTKIEACHIKRSSSHKTLRKLARWGKTGSGWFYGLKLHAIVNEEREIVNICLTPGNVADNNEALIRAITQGLHGKIFGDKGYILNEELWTDIYYQGLQFITHIRANMKQKLMPMDDKLSLNNRTSRIETFFGILKDRMSLQYTRVRSVYGFICNVISMLIAYQLRVTKKYSDVLPNALPVTVETLSNNALVTAY